MGKEDLYDIHVEKKVKAINKNINVNIFKSRDKFIIPTLGYKDIMKIHHKFMVIKMSNLWETIQYSRGNESVKT